MILFCKRIAESEGFQSFILFLIVVTAVTMGFETVPEISDRFGAAFLLLDAATQAIFAFEIFVRVMSFAPTIGRFFRNGWNLFDFVVVVASFLPVVGPFALVARVLRAVRVLRVLSVSDRLRNFMDRLKDSVQPLFCATIVAALFSYMFAISGHYLFSEIDPVHWGTLGRSALTIFYLLLLQEVGTFVQPLIAISRSAIIFFLLFYLVFMSLGIAVLVAAISRSGGGHED